MIDAAVAHRFPLTARPRPPCTPLVERVADLSHRARTALHNQDVTAATAVFNLAALLASDCGMPDLARRWCHRLAHAGLRTPPSDPKKAIHSLEPIVNLARLRIRAGDGIAAWQLLEDLHSAVQAGRDIAIDAIEIPLSCMTSSTDTHRELRAWTWTVLLADGGRALAAAGRWEDARRRLAQYNGIGSRMLDGRQIAVLAHATGNRRDDALALVHATSPGQVWENAVTACLTLLCQPHRPDEAGLDDLLAPYRELGTAAGLAIFRTRLGLSLLDALGVQDPVAGPLAADLVESAGADGYAAREILAHPGCRSLAGSHQQHDLACLVESCGLDRGDIPHTLLTDLADTLDTAESVITYATVGRSVR